MPQGWNLAKREEEHFFRAIGKDPEHSERLKNAMMLFLTRPTMRLEFALKSFHWATYSNVTVVDISGSHGLVAMELAKAYLNLRVIVQDQPEVIETAAASVPRDLSQRVTFMAHDFFQE